VWQLRLTLPLLPGEEERRMANFLEYNPEQGYLLPPTVREVLGEGHLCFFVHGAVEAGLAGA
jgi:hypothetical protein